MDASSVIAIAGLTTALLGTLTVPLLQSHFTGRREAASREEQRQHDAYVDAISYAQVIEARLQNLLDDPLVRSDRPTPTVPDPILIRAKLQLVAPGAVAQAFEKLAICWENLTWNLTQDGPTGPYNEFVLKPGDKDAVLVATALKNLKTAIRPQKLGAIEA